MAQSPDAAGLVAELADPAKRASARVRLLGLGAASAVPLADALATASADDARELLDILRELGPEAGAAAPALLAWLRGQTEWSLEALATWAELVPHRGNDVEWTDRDLSRLVMAGRRDPFEARASLLVARLRARGQVPRDLDLEQLLALARARAPLAAEVAIEKLGLLGAAGARAVPLLRAVLERPEPRVLPTDERVPLHRKAARALLAIAPDAPEAAAARSVQAGTWAPPVPADPVLPERVQRRIAELLADLAAADVARREAACENLVALGPIVARPVAGLLDVGVPAATIDAAFCILRRLGRHATPAVPRIVEAITTLPAAHTIAAVRTLAAVAPWSRDLVTTLVYESSAGRLKILGHRIAGTIDVAFLDEFDVAAMELHIAMDVSVDAPLAQLRTLLADAVVARRCRALEVIAARGGECAALLDAVGAMLQASHPMQVSWVRTGAQGIRSVRVDRTEHVQRLAATTILAIAAADHPLVVEARSVLARPPAR